MAEPLVAHDDLDLFLTTWYRAWLAALPSEYALIVSGVVVDIQEPPADEFPERLVLLRTMDRTRTSLLTADALVHVEVLAGTFLAPKPAVDLMRVVLAGLDQIAGTDLETVGGLRNPVSVLQEQNGPYPVAEAHDRARLFANATFGVTAVPL